MATVAEQSMSLQTPLESVMEFAKWSSQKFVPRLLTTDQKQRRVNVCLELREANEDPTLISRIIPGNQSCIYSYDETQSNNRRCERARNHQEPKRHDRSGVHQRAWALFFVRDQKKKLVCLEQGPLGLVSTTEELLDRKVAASVYRTENTAVGIRQADHVAPSIRKSWQSLRRQAVVTRSV
jgi:hypothetical protein